MSRDVMAERGDVIAARGGSPAGHRVGEEEDQNGFIARRILEEEEEEENFPQTLQDQDPASPHGAPALEEVSRPSSDTLVSSFKLEKLEKDAQKNWDLFYKRNSTNFFKDRHWTSREFQELRACRTFDSQRLVLLEAGCGVGNCIFPLLQDDLHLFVYACDFSPRAVDFVKKNPLYVPERISAFQCDLTQDDLRQQVPEGSVDIVTLIFVLSAVHPHKMQQVVHNISRVLKPGGHVLFRDYGVNDHAMKRFKASSKLGENFYVRQDGTRTYFFSREFVADLFLGAGLQSVSNDYVFRETVNKKENLSVARVFLQSKFTKTGQSETSMSQTGQSETSISQTGQSETNQSLTGQPETG